MKKFVRLFGIIAVITLLAVPVCFGQDKPAEVTQPQAQTEPMPAEPAQGGPATPPVAVQPDAASEETQPVKEIAIYGEVQSVDTSAGSLTVQYYDYDSDEEKKLDITVNSSTQMENASALADIAKADWVDVTYVTADGKNTAKSILVEKEEKEEEEMAALSSPENEPGMPKE